MRKEKISMDFSKLFEFPKEFDETFKVYRDVQEAHCMYSQIMKCGVSDNQVTKSTANISLNNMKVSTVGDINV